MYRILKDHKVPILVAAIAALMYGSFAYDLFRSDFIKLVTLYIGLFGLSYYLLLHFGWNIRLLIGLGIIYRLVFLLALPNLSQDFYRFLWDGNVVLEGGNPYLFTPESYLAHPESYDLALQNSQELYEGMGWLNGSHFSNYPPINQLFFAIASWLGGKSVLGGVVALRMMIILADIGIIYFGIKLLKLLQLPMHNIFWYFLNPFIIIELTGNLHFEGVMLFFLLAGLYALILQKWIGSAFLIAISISVKLIPLLLLPVLLQFLWKKKAGFIKNIYHTVRFYMLVLILAAISFAPYINYNVWSNYIRTTALWFQNFEFNASIYFIIRWIGFQTVGWNVIETTGKVLPIIVVLFVLSISLIRKNNTPKALMEALLFAIGFHLLLATTVHPWYLATPLLLSIFTRFRFPLVWSLTIVLSYSAYKLSGVEENLGIIFIEYGIVIGYACWELGFKTPRSQKPTPASQNI